MIVYRQRLIHGMHYWTHDEGEYVMMRTDEYYATIYNRYDRPIGTLIRPRRDNADGHEWLWHAASADGGENVAIALTARIAFRRFIREYRRLRDATIAAGIENQEVGG